MKTLLFLPLIILLVACTPEPTEEELTAARNATLVDKSMEIFKHNETILEDELYFGEECLLRVERTGKTTSEECDMYYLAHKAAYELSVKGVKIVFALANSGLLQKDGPYFMEVIEIVERLATREREAKRLGTKIEQFTSSSCVKCVM